MTPKAANEKQLTPVAVQILLSLSDCELHGYGIKLDIESRTGGDMSLGSGTLYEAIQRLRRDGLIAETNDRRAGDDGRKRRYYRLTDFGRGNLERELAGMEAIVSFARSRNLIPDSRPA